MKKRILFVDDDENILNTIKVMLAPMLAQWEMVFSADANDALSFMRKHPIDVIVADLEMPGMNGIELLRSVKEMHPGTLRFILSDADNKSAVLKTVGITDLFIVKPFQPDVLQGALREAIASQELVSEGTMRTLVNKMESLPTLPKLYLKLKEILESERSSFRDIADVISKDVAITAKILQLVNSAFFGLRNRIESLQYALTFLGIETIKAVIIMTGVFSQFKQNEVEQFEINKLYYHSYLVGLIGRHIAQSISQNRRFADEATMAGMLHDLGKLIFIRNFPTTYHHLYHRHKMENIPLHKLEQEQFDHVDHAVIGGYLMKLWALPHNIVESITYHHNPIHSLDTSFNINTVVYITNILEHEQSDLLAKTIRGGKLGRPYLNKLDLLKYLPEWKKVTDAMKLTHQREKFEEFK